MRFINLLISRFKASYGAFKNPQAFYDGDSLQETVSKLELRREFCILSGEYYKGSYFPKFQMIPYETQHAIRHGLGVNI